MTDTRTLKGTLMMETLLLKYRPSKISHVLGQPDVTRALKLFLREPYSTAFLFHGDSGVGKTATAYALAHELGCAVEEKELGGLHEIASGEQTADTVREMLNALRLRPLFGEDGWKVLIVNEADKMSGQAEAIWLDGLEHLPAKTVAAFTTNRPEALSKRFRHRCETYFFESDTKKIGPAIRALGKRVWKAEGCRGTCPALDTLGMPTLGDLEDMNASFRLALQQLGRFIREARLGSAKNLGRVRKQVEKDLLITNDQFKAACDHCGTEQLVSTTIDRHRCQGCGETFKCEW